MLKKILHSHWSLVAMLLVGLIVGYSVVVAQRGEIFAAWECPAKELCEGGNCEHIQNCSSGACSRNCPGNCHSKES
ncbi:MAG TPA: hypothetical protein VJB10_00650 [Candidatus Peribacteraceae bacterium]|nr:hypothetical protein [Candidatus Peribacteraceae bacterium]